MHSLNKLYLAIAIAVSAIAMSAGYGYSCSLRNQIAEIWKQTLYEDCANRMSEVNVRKILTFSVATSSDIKIETESQTLHIKKDSTQSYTDIEKDFLADQYCLSVYNPVNIEKLENLFQARLREKGVNCGTAVSIYSKGSAQKTLCGVEDVTGLHDYLKLAYKVDVKDVILLEAYVKGGWLERLLWGKSYYIVLSLILLGALILLVSGKKRPKSLMQPVPANPVVREIPSLSPVEPVLQNVEPVTEFMEVQAQPKLDSRPTPLVIFMDKKKHILVYEDKEILLAPKLLNLFYLLAQGKDYFQSYDVLLQNLWQEKGNADKKHLEQLVIRLRKELENVPISIDAIRGSGYQIKGESNMGIVINIQPLP